MRAPIRQWSTQLEDALFLSIAERHAPQATAPRSQPPRGPETAAEFAALRDDWIRTAAHDLFIVQVTANAIGTLFAGDAHMQLILSRQLGDDGDHAVEARRHLQAIDGIDPLPEIQRHVDEHRERAGDIPFRSIAGFLAFEFHYELYILARLQLVRRTSRIADTAMKSFAETRIRPDEAFHRAAIVQWWLEAFSAKSDSRRAQDAADILAFDDELQRRLNPFLRHELDDMPRVYAADISGARAAYDDWRRALLSMLLDRPSATLGALTSIVE
jgi:hypothetical protein